MGNYEELSEDEVLDLIRKGATTKQLNNDRCKKAVINLFFQDKIIVDEIYNGYSKIIEKGKQTKL